MTFGSVSGDFATFEGLDIGGGLYFNPVLDKDAGEYRLQVAQLPGGLTVAVTSPTTDDFFEFLTGKDTAVSLTFTGSFTVLGQTLAGEFLIERNEAGKFEIGTRDLATAFAGSSGDIVTITAGEVGFFLSDAAFAGAGTATVSISAGEYNLSGDYAFRVNSGNLPVQTPVSVEGLNPDLAVSLNLLAGPYVRVVVPEAAGEDRLQAAGKTFEGSYTLEPATTADGDHLVAVAVTGLSVSFEIDD